MSLHIKYSRSSAWCIKSGHNNGPIVPLIGSYHIPQHNNSTLSRHHWENRYILLYLYTPAISITLVKVSNIPSSIYGMSDIFRHDELFFEMKVLVHQSCMRLAAKIVVVPSLPPSDVSRLHINTMYTGD